MRILVLQLARFGDIYQSWPAVRGLQRKHPGAEIHILVRSRFRAATSGLAGVTVHELPTAEILRPVYQNGDETAAAGLLETFLEALPAFDQVLNLSYSPFSSYLTDILASRHNASAPAAVRGYTRHSDGFLAIPDDPSAYFYAQVGIGRPNRYHLTDVFAATCDVELTEADFAPPRPSNLRREDQIIVHLGASQIEKAYPAELWSQALVKLEEIYEGEIAVIGSADETALNEAVCKSTTRVRNLTGKTTLSELFELIQHARLLIGADSAPIHIAGLTNTPVLNVSSSTVNFWETGPTTPGSRILYSPEMASVPPERIAEEAVAMLNGRDPLGPCFIKTERHERYIAHQISTDDFAWNLIEALYTGTPYPEAPSTAERIGFQRLFELAELALQQLAQWEGPNRETAARILASVDEMLPEVSRLCPNVEPVVQWFQTQRLRLPPADAAVTLSETRRLFEELLWITAVYHQDTEGRTDRGPVLKLIGECAAELREHDFAAIEPNFQTLVSALHELSRHSTNVGARGRSWSSVLTEAQEAIQRKDFTALADLLEYEVAPGLTF